MIPEHWRSVKLGDVITLQRGFDITKAQQREGVIPVISSSGIASYHDTAMVSGPGVIIGRKGTLGTTFFVEGEYWPHDTTLWVKDFKGNDPKFVFYLLQYLREELLALEHGTANPTLNRNHAHLLSVRCPPLQEQIRISSILDALDQKIKLNAVMHETLEELASGMFKSWFLDFDPVVAKAAGKIPIEMDKRTIALFPEGFEDSTLGPIPKGWHCLTLDQALINIIDHRGKTPKKLQGDWSPSGIPVLSAKNIKTGRITNKADIRFIPHEMYDRWMTEKLDACDILLTSEGPLGEAFFLTEQRNFCLGQRVFALRADRSVASPYYLYQWLISLEGQQELESRATGTTVSGIRQSELRRCKLLIPPLVLQRRFEEIAEPIFTKIRVTAEESEILAELRECLLPRLLSGNVTFNKISKELEQVL